ncbi:hypothetical protein HMPREF0156_01344 [Bacteroidetes oral taxon 274 str. F0058]|nr:hypothetical protein HMPREF0156_01344 [Bacteroidetes oral taxon 274 str. F0058]
MSYSEYKTHLRKSLQRYKENLKPPIENRLSVSPCRIGVSKTNYSVDDASKTIKIYLLPSKTEYRRELFVANVCVSKKIITFAACIFHC